jgi:hypothetical protein
MSRTVDEKPPAVIVDQPNPTALRGYEQGRRLWLRDDLDAAILPDDLKWVRDVDEDL